MNNPEKITKPIPELTDGLQRLCAVVHDLRSPGGCPWDREQTHESLVHHLLEEAYEAAEAIRTGETSRMEDELGDVLLQVVMHAEIGSETGRFDLNSIAHAVSEKLIRRHPHVYGESGVKTSDQVLAQWEQIKSRERGEDAKPYLHGVGSGLPSLARAAKLQKKASKVGFDWPDSTGIIEKIKEELTEVEAETPASAARGAEIGDLLFIVANLARKEGFDPEVLLHAANEKFVRRFHAAESDLKSRGLSVEQAGFTELEAAYQKAKKSGV